MGRKEYFGEWAIPLAQFPPFTIPTNFTLSRFPYDNVHHFHFHRFMVVKGRGRSVGPESGPPGLRRLSNPQGQHTEKQSSLHLLAKMSRGKANKKKHIVRHQSSLKKK
jgi:hypothetical protein